MGGLESDSEWEDPSVKTLAVRIVLEAVQALHCRRDQLHAAFSQSISYTPHQSLVNVSQHGNPCLMSGTVLEGRGSEGNFSESNL